MKRSPTTGVLWKDQGADDAARGDIAVPPGLVIRETPCRSILTSSALSDYALNAYTGCSHGCAYCYARFMQRFHPHAEPWGRFVDVKVNAVDVLRRQLRRAAPGDVFISSACDGWQPVERQYGLTRRCCELLIERGFAVHALTKSDLILRDLDLLAAGNARVGVSIATLDENQRALWEPGASGIEARLKVVAEAKRSGLRTGIMFAPLLPGLSDSTESLNAMFERAADLTVDNVWVDGLNARPKVWPSVSALLHREFPSLHEEYRRILFDPAARDAYTTALRRRVSDAATRVGLRERTTICL